MSEHQPRPEHDQPCCCHCGRALVDAKECASCLTNTMRRVVEDALDREEE